MNRRTKLIVGLWMFVPAASRFVSIPLEDVLSIRGISYLLASVIGGAFISNVVLADD